MFSKMSMSLVLDFAISSDLIIEYRRAKTEVAITPTTKKEITLRPRSIMYDIKIWKKHKQSYLGHFQMLGNVSVGL